MATPQESANEAEQQRDRLEQAAMILFAASAMSASDSDEMEGTDRTHVGRLVAQTVQWFSKYLRLQGGAATIVPSQGLIELERDAAERVIALKAWMRAQPPRDPGEMTLQRTAARGFATSVFNNVGMAVGAQAPDMTLRKVWITRKDPRVRPLHRRLHGRSRRLESDFWRWPGTEQRLAFPGDTRAPMDAWVGCRCVLLITAAPSTEINDAFPPLEED